MTPRTRIYRLLDNARSKGSAVWVGAPPGTGKTTLVSGFVEHRQIPAIWLRLGRTGNDGNGLLGQLRQGMAESPWLDETAGRGATLRSSFINLINTAPSPFALVIDQMEKARTALQQELLQLAQMDTGSMLPVFISRTPPPRGLGSLRGSSGLRVIGWPQLRLTRREAAAVARAWGWGRPSASMIDRLLADSGGWVGGFVLLLDQMRERRPAVGDAGRQALAAYFTSGVLADMGASAARFSSSGNGEKPADPLDATHWPWRIRITTLGAFSVEGSDADATPPVMRGPRGPVRLLQMLIAQGPKGISQGELVAAMWPESTPEAGVRALGTTLHRLRRMLSCDACVERIQGQVRLNPAVAWVDAWVFERRTAQPDGLAPSSDGRRKRLLEDALALYRGRFLADTPSPWVASVRDRLHAVYVTHQRQRADELEQASDWHRLEQVCLSGLEADPLCEPFCRGLMSARIGQGRTAEAVNAFEVLKSALREATGAQPSAETLSLYARLKPLRD